ncbi:FKBP-type peptidyl-prolyl cis-trans isomerase [Pontibacter anaerobius]|uniref:Peptidyl-prolyl cis-trans isomerase n=1 Tax=Pontibacter anaerobius TaxID=2993940 RepID=A0ABT3R9Y2_9BACT|nr:FKBP-type peptidyl-prolyl cis-trans isomerase [Pontibacter anaerobius]MCX2738379.1 FKBP-type peptidyl-prolyl cis-trans isomerase [Pontibacter anaerobius]
MISMHKSNNRGRLLQALLLLFVALSFAACKDDTPQKEKDDQQIQQYFQANNIDPATVTKTSSGLYYQVLVEGTGDKVFPGDKVKVHYVGTLLNGTKFDSSIDRGEPYPLTVGVGQVIAGWDEGLQLMRDGEKARLFIPSHLGYGRRGSYSIPANSPLVFEVEVLEILP